MKRIIAAAIGLAALTLVAYPQAKCKNFDKKGKPMCCKAKGWASCPAAGCGGDPLLNAAKNRTDKAADNAPVSTIIQVANFKHPKSWKSGTPRDLLVSWGEGTPLRVTLYLQKVKNYTDGAESCNCNIDGDRNNDYHLVLGRTKNAAEKQSLTAEITPRIRPDTWNYKKLSALAKAKTYVRVTGWAMLDTQHVGKPVPVRKTHWEIHPVTRFEVCTATKAACDADDGWKDLEDMP